MHTHTTQKYDKNNMEYLVVQITIPTNDEPFDDDNDDNEDGNYLVEIMVIYMVLINKLQSQTHTHINVFSLSL